MKFGVVYPAYGPYCDPKLAERVARAAEKEGLDSMLVWDHYMLPQSDRTLEAYSLLSYLAGKTERLRLGTCVTPMPFRNPAMLAKTIATLDVLSNGRVIVGVGAGWHKPEFDGYSTWDEAKVRVRKTKEALELITKLWTERRVDFEGKYYHAKGAVLEPKPIQRPYPPLWFGTVGRVMLELAIKYGSGWIPIDISPVEYRRYASLLKERLPRARREGFTFAYVGWPMGASELTREVERYRWAGCDYFCLVLDPKPEKVLDQLKLLGELSKSGAGAGRLTPGSGHPAV